MSADGFKEEAVFDVVGMSVCRANPECGKSRAERKYVRAGSGNTADVDHHVRDGASAAEAGCAQTFLLAAAKDSRKVPKKSRYKQTLRNLFAQEQWQYIHSCLQIPRRHIAGTNLTARRATPLQSPF